MVVYKKTSAQGEPAVLYCEKESPPAGARFGPIIRRAYIIECNVSGYGTVTVNGKTFSITPGDCYVLLPGVSVSYTTDEHDPRQGYWCYVDGLPLERHFKTAGITPETPFAAKEAFPEIRDWLIKMVDNWDREDHGGRLLHTACLYGILAAFNKDKTPSYKEHVVEKAIALMETNYSEDLNVSDLAEKVGMARAYFSTRFKEETGSTPHEYLTALRIQKACLLLESAEEHSVEEIAYLVGSDPKNFSRQFKKQLGKTPREYKRMLGK